MEYSSTTRATELWRVEHEDMEEVKIGYGFPSTSGETGEEADAPELETGRTAEGCCSSRLHMGKSTRRCALADESAEAAPLSSRLRSCKDAWGSPPRLSTTFS